MSPCKPARDIKVHVPRHSSQRLGPAVTAQVQHLAKRRRMRVDVRQTAYEPSNILAQAIDSASEWNSLLTTARAERGPQWDIGTQQFLVEEHSHLYYDPSPLREYLKESQPESDENGASSSKPPVPTPDFSNNVMPGTPQLRRNPSMPPPAQPHMPFSPRHPGAGGFPAQMQFSGMGGPVPPGQFYGNDPSMSSPIRMGSIGMGMDGMGGMGGMGGMTMGSPGVPRRMGTRGMGMDDGFGGMH